MRTAVDTDEMDKAPGQATRPLDASELDELDALLGRVPIGEDRRPELLKPWLTRLIGWLRRPAPDA